MNDKIWAGEFGDEYTKRNRVKWWLRVPFWTNIVGKTMARSYLEYGCNAGWNLSAIKDLDCGFELQGHEINREARLQAHSAGLDVVPEWHMSRRAELVFTAGVLIHVPTKRLSEVMQQIYDLSYDYILAVEYEAEDEEMVEYQGQANLLWKRPYGQIYMNMFPDLTAIETGEAGEDVGFDNCRYWLFRK